VAVAATVGSVPVPPLTHRAGWRSLRPQDPAAPAVADLLPASPSLGGSSSETMHLLTLCPLRPDSLVDEAAQPLPGGGVHAWIQLARAHRLHRLLPFGLLEGITRRPSPEGGRCRLRCCPAALKRCRRDRVEVSEVVRQSFSLEWAKRTVGNPAASRGERLLAAKVIADIRAAMSLPLKVLHGREPIPSRRPESSERTRTRSREARPRRRQVAAASGDRPRPSADDDPDPEPVDPRQRGAPDCPRCGPGSSVNVRRVSWVRGWSCRWCAAENWRRDIELQIQRTLDEAERITKDVA
jgi:hypothetical protein